MQRRSFLAGTTALVAVLPLASAHATPESLQAAIREVVGSAALREGKVKIDLPALVENGNTVPLGVTVDSPMTATDRVKAIHVFNEKNPQPFVITVRLTPRNGRARIATRMKLADTQTVIAVAEMSDGSFWKASAEVIVTIAACIEDIN